MMQDNDSQPKARRVPLSMRVTPQMHDRLVSAAQQSGRSITQEIELRLEIADLLVKRNFSM
jgi:predicted HicB family RNase H-like nuclease